MEARCYDFLFSLGFFLVHGGGVSVSGLNGDHDTMSCFPFLFLYSSS